MEPPLVTWQRWIACGGPATLLACGTQGLSWRFLYVSYVGYATCLLNAYVFESKLLQIVLHDVFAYLVAHGLLVTQRPGVCTWTQYWAVLMLWTRAIYGRCLFLWWTNGRCKKMDVCILGALVASLCRAHEPLCDDLMALGLVLCVHVRDMRLRGFFTSLVVCLVVAYSAADRHE